MEGVMVNPVVCGVLAAGAGVALRLADNAADCLWMRGRVQLVQAVAQVAAEWWNVALEDHTLS
jgi:hypothetical protein